MKTTFLAILLNLAIISSIVAQQSDPPLSISIESAKIIGDKILIAGKMTVESPMRIMRLSIQAVTPDGDQHKLTKFWWAAEPTYLSSFDIRMHPNIPYSFEAAFDSKNKDIKQLTALVFEAFNHTTQKSIRIPFQNIAVPSSPNPNLGKGTIEIDKDIYLKWTKYEETAKGLRIHFTILNKANKDKMIVFQNYIDNTTIILDKNGIQYKKYNQTLKDRTTYPVNIPVAGYFEIEEPLKMADVNMLQFNADWTTLTITDFQFQK